MRTKIAELTSILVDRTISSNCLHHLKAENMPGPKKSNQIYTWDFVEYEIISIKLAKLNAESHGNSKTALQSCNLVARTLVESQI